jgi:hypothetical protein
MSGYVRVRIPRVKAVLQQAAAGAARVAQEHLDGPSQDDAGKCCGN